MYKNGKKYIVNNLIMDFKRFVISTSFFWKIIQYIDPGFINSYEKKITHDYLLNFASDNKISSVLDFGCGRGDYFNWYNNTYGAKKIKYTGVDIDKTLIDAGKELYKGIKLINKDWNRLPNKIVCDWSININSNNYSIN